MNRGAIRRTIATVSATLLAAGVLAIGASTPVGAGVQGPSTPATAPPRGSGVQVIVGQIIVGGAQVERDQPAPPPPPQPQPLGPLSFT